MTKFSFTTNTELSQAATLGLIILKADETIELDFRRLLPNDVALHVSRIESEPNVSSQALIKMKGRLTQAASLFPDASNFNCVGFACTSGTSVIGANEVEKRILAGCKTAAATNPVTALISACNQMKINRIAILSPYVEDVSYALRNVLFDNNIQTPNFGSFEESEEAKVVRIDGRSIISAADTLTKDANIDALFISCTNLRTLDVIDQIEQKIKKPVLTSNQVLAWHMATRSGFAMCHNGFGELLKPTSL